MELTRRSILRAGGSGLAVASLAGCIDETAIGDNGANSLYAAFFTLADWSDQIVDSQFEVNNPVPVGEIGHGWDPPGDIVRDIAGSRAFVYLDTPEFAWSQNVAKQLTADYDSVTVIDGLTGLDNSDLLPFQRPETAEADFDHDWNAETVSISSFEILEPTTDEAMAYWHGDHWHGGLPAIAADDSISLPVVARDDDDRVLPIGNDHPFELQAEVADGGPDDIVSVDISENRILITGRTTGQTLLAFSIVSDNEVIFSTKSDPIVASVVEEVDEEDHMGFFDPHVWVDPILAIKIVDAIAKGISEIDPQNEEVFTERRDKYVTRLESVDNAFRSMIDDASRDVAVFAGHDSFQYIENRYGFELHTPVGVSPDAAESFDDIARLVDIIEQHDIETILYNPFETSSSRLPSMVQLLLDNTDATDATPLSPAEGSTAEWNDRGWGWVEQMEELNIPSLRAALGAD